MGIKSIFFWILHIIILSHHYLLFTINILQVNNAKTQRCPWIYIRNDFS